MSDFERLEHMAIDALIKILDRKIAQYLEEKVRCDFHKKIKTNGNVFYPNFGAKHD